MIKKHLKNNYKLYLLYLIVIVISWTKVDYYIYSSGSLVDLKDRIIVDNYYESNGSINLTYVTTRHATILTYLISYINPDWDLESIKNIKADNESIDDAENRGKISLKETSYDSVIAAFKELNMDYKVNNVDIYVTYLFSDSNTSLEVGDIIKSVNGLEVNSKEEISNIINEFNENDIIKINVLRNDKIVECYATIKVIDNKKIIGVYLSLIKDIETNPRVKFVFKDSESGSSRGLMCAIDIYNKLTKDDITHGDIIAGTGSIDENGIVYEISGIKYKLKGAVKNKAKVFICPIENYDEAIELKEKNNFDIEIIGVKTLNEAIEKLNIR